MDNKEIKVINKILRNGFDRTGEYYFYKAIYDIFTEHYEEYDYEFLIEQRETVLDTLLENSELFWKIEELVSPLIEDIIKEKL